MKACANCGAPVGAQGRSSTSGSFCSKSECVAARRRVYADQGRVWSSTKSPSPPKTCAHCGDSVHPSGRRPKFGSFCAKPECAEARMKAIKEHNKRQRRATWEPCEGCGTPTAPGTIASASGHYCAKPECKRLRDRVRRRLGRADYRDQVIANKLDVHIRRARREMDGPIARRPGAG